MATPSPTIPTTIPSTLPTKPAPTAAAKPNGTINPPSVTDAQGLANTALQAYNPSAASVGAAYVPGQGLNSSNIAIHEAGAATNPGLAPYTAASYQAIQNQPGDTLDPNSGQANQTNTATQQTANAGVATDTHATASQATASSNPGAATYNAATIGSMTPQAIAAQGQVDPRSLMQNQYTQLMDFPPNQVPDWAKGAVATANASLAAHGLGASSVAGQAITSALMQAALPIASNDANVFATMNLTNLSNQQQAVIVNTQARVQTMMSDQAAVNASKQFNATSTNQTNQFYSSLATQVSQFNAAQLTAVSQSNAALDTQTSQFNATQTTATSEFNAAQGNAISQFNTQLAQQQQQFNANNQLIVDQSNVQWQRQINTANTAGVNQANNTNAANLLNISNTAVNNIWQQMRDQANYSFTAGQNDQNRAATLASAQLNSQNSLTYLAANYSLAQQAQLGQAIGGFASNLLGPSIGAAGQGLASIFGNSNPSGLNANPVSTIGTTGTIGGFQDPGSVPTFE